MKRLPLLPHHIIEPSAHMSGHLNLLSAQDVRIRRTLGLCAWTSAPFGLNTQSKQKGRKLYVGDEADACEVTRREVIHNGEALWGDDRYTRTDIHTHKDMYTCACTYTQQLVRSANLAKPPAVLLTCSLPLRSPWKVRQSQQVELSLCSATPSEYGESRSSQSARLQQHAGGEMERTGAEGLVLARGALRELHDGCSVS